MRITNFQLFAILFVTTAVIPYEVMPRLLTLIVGHHAWLVPLAAFLPGLLLLWLYDYLLRNSTNPFPVMLEEHLGRWLGRFLGFLYIGIFFLVVVISLVVFANFFLSNVLPNTPISVLLFFMILPAFYALRTGMEAISRTVEMVVMTGYPLAMIILLLGIGAETEWSRLLPLGGIHFSGFMYAVMVVLSYSSGTIIVLTLGKFCQDSERVLKWMVWALIFFTATTVFSVIVPIINFGTALTSVETFPIFNIARSTNIGGFIHNIEIILVSAVIPGVYAVESVFWFMTCYTAQQVFGLRDYRILVGPTALLAGFLAVLATPNIHILYVILHQVLPWIPFVAFAILPVVLAVAVWIGKRRQRLKTRPIQPGFK